MLRNGGEEPYKPYHNLWNQYCLHSDVESQYIRRQNQRNNGMIRRVIGRTRTRGTKGAPHGTPRSAMRYTLNKMKATNSGRISVRYSAVLGLKMCWLRESGYHKRMKPYETLWTNQNKTKEEEKEKKKKPKQQNAMWNSDHNKDITTSGSIRISQTRSEEEEEEEGEEKLTMSSEGCF